MDDRPGPLTAEQAAILDLLDRIVVLESALKYAMARLDRLEKEAKAARRSSG